MEDPRSEEIWFEAHRDEVEKMRKKDCSCNVQKEMENLACHFAPTAQNQYILNMIKNSTSQNPLLNEEMMMNRIENVPSYLYEAQQNIEGSIPIVPHEHLTRNDIFSFLALGHLLGKFDSDKKEDEEE